MKLPSNTFSIFKKKKVKIRTDYSLLFLANNIWKAIVLSFVFDGLSIAFPSPVTIPQEIAVMSEPILVLLLISTLLLLLLRGAQLRLRNSLLRQAKRTRIFLYLFAFLAVMIPLSEILLQFQVGAAVPMAFVSALIVIAVGRSIFHTIQNVQAHSLAPRNRFLHIHKTDLTVMLQFVAGIVLSRFVSLFSLWLYLGSVTSQNFFIIFEVVSLVLIWCFKPTYQSFYSVCPTCRHYRSKALDGLSMCPQCSKRVFFQERIQYS